MTYFLDVYGTVIDEASETAYEDARAFLHAMGNEAILISRAESRDEIQTALSGIPRLTIILTHNKPKAEFLSEQSHLLAAQSLFVDDSPGELALMETLHPQVKLYEIRRDGKEGDGRWPVVRSLAELP